MLRILHFIYDDPANPWVAGGGAVRVREIYRRLATRLSEVTVVTGNFPGARSEVIDGVRYRRVGIRSPYWLSRATFSAEASRLLRWGRYDAAVVDFSTYAPIIIPPGRPVGLTVHHITGVAATARWGKPLGRLIIRQEIARLRQAGQITATSQVTLTRLRNIVGSGAEIRLIMAGVPDELFALPRREADYLLYFGRLDWHQKGLDILFDALAILVKTEPDLRLIVAGRGKDRERVIQGSYDRGIRENVHVVGSVGDPERDELLSGARILVMPSRFEGFGMVAAEAMAAGVPVISSDAGSLPEVVDPPSGGLTVPSEDPAALAAAMRSLLDNPAERRNLSRSARESAERFRWEEIAEQHLDFLYDLADLPRQKPESLHGQ